MRTCELIWLFDFECVCLFFYLFKPNSISSVELCVKNWSVIFEKTFHPASRPSLLVQAAIKNINVVADVQTSKLHIQTNVLICRNSSHTVQSNNQVLSPSCQSQCSPKLCMALYFIYDYIFPCHLKVRKSRFAGRNWAAKAFHRDRAAFISRTGWESCGMWGSYSADTPYHLYIASIMLRSWIIFYMQNICAVIWENSGSRPDLHVIKIRQIRVISKTKWYKILPEKNQCEWDACLI